MTIEAAALAGLRWVVSPIVNDLVKKSIAYLGNDIAKGIEDLETILLPQFQLTIQAAQHRPPDVIAPLAKWLARLKNAYFDAEGILHELEYEQLKWKAKGKDKKFLVRLSSKPIIKPLAKFIGRVIKRASVLSSQKRKLLQRLNTLKEIAAEAKTLRDLLGPDIGVEVGNNRSPTSSLLAHKVFGRDGERDHIINFLLYAGESDRDHRNHRDHYSVVAITGMGGAGKTTLAQYIYNDQRVETHFPTTRIWLSLSRNLDIIECTKEMIECVSQDKCPDISNLSVLQNKLREKLSESGNIMVVLDDVWCESETGENQWEDLLKPFALQGSKCKIMVTSRSSGSIPNALQPGKLIELRDLAPDDFISLLRYHAIDGLKINEKLYNDLSDIVDQIARKMNKSPLAAKVVGNQLCKRPNITFWRATLENVDLSDTGKILLWSFHRFDVQLQRCFLFCSVFPKGARFYDMVSSFWVALDFIQPSNDNRNVEDIGLEYFEIMVANSIFHPVDKTHKLYTMHDLFHDLAENLSVGDSFRVTNTEREIPKTVQHVYLRVNNEILKEKLSSISNLSNLRTLILGNPFIDDISEIITNISINFRNLRVLEVMSSGYKIVPRVIGNLKNLRFLSFWRGSINELPDSVSQLYHIQFLILPSSVRTLPNKLSNLIKLRRIEMYDNNANLVSTLPPVPYLGKLTSLQHLNEFHVRKVEGYEMHQLGCLKEIGGSLRIVNLENVRDKEEAVQARLIDKPKLKRLELVWDESVENNGVEVDVIEALQPPTNLEWLRIQGYRGSTYPIWLQEGSFIENVRGVRFNSCNALTILPRNFHQFRHCSELVLENLGALKELSIFPEYLDTLSIIKCPSLILVCENELQVNENQSSLEQKFICSVGDANNVLDHELKSFDRTCSKENCAELLQIMESAAEVNQLEYVENVNNAWWRCHQQRMNFIFNLPPERAKANKLKLPSKLCALHLGYCCVSDGVLSSCLRGLTTLEELYLSGIMTITTLPPTQFMESLKSLRVVEIKHCWYLRSLGGLHALPYLQRFLIEDCWCLEMDSPSSPLPRTLQSFVINRCIVSQGIFNGDFPCLKNVEINYCHIPEKILSFHQLTLLESLVLVLCIGLKTIEGLESRPFISTLHLVLLSDLDVDSVRKCWQGCREQLYISNSLMMNKLLSFPDFVPPRWLSIRYCQEQEISFEKSDHLQSIKVLRFMNCDNLRMIQALSYFSTLEFMVFIDCPKLSELPELPSSIQHITIRGCPMLRERCLPNGLDWHKIRCIQSTDIE